MGSFKKDLYQIFWKVAYEISRCQVRMSYKVVSVKNFPRFRLIFGLKTPNLGSEKIICTIFSLQINGGNVRKWGQYIRLTAARIYFGWAWKVPFKGCIINICTVFQLSNPSESWAFFYVCKWMYEVSCVRLQATNYEANQVNQVQVRNQV